jgi:hypothetical protein
LNEFGVENSGQLVLPPEKVWRVSVANDSARIMTFGVRNRYVVVDYKFESIVIARRGSIKRSAESLGEIGGVWTETVAVPLDPEFFFQRTRYACVDESKVPVYDVSSQNVWRYFDSTCVPKNTTLVGATKCHDRFNSKQTCLRAMQRSSGVTRLNIRWERIPYSADVADKYRVGGPKNVSRDISNVRPSDFNIVYKYIPEDSCLLRRNQCLQGSGWRRLLQWTTGMQHVGKFRFLNIARVTSKPQDTPFVSNNLYTRDECFGDFEYSSFAQYQIDGIDGRPLATCIHDSARTLNHEYSPMATRYDSCEWQGLSAGWSYEIPKGSPCQWVDITSVTDAEEKRLRSSLNPNSLICEGINQYTPKPKRPIWGETVTAKDTGVEIHRPECELIDEFASNNELTRRLKPRARQSAVTTRCPRNSRPITFLRDCGWRVMYEQLTCKPGETTKITLSIDTTGLNSSEIQNLPTVTVRLCESSQALGGISTRCEYIDALGHANIAPTTSTILSFTCPDRRDDKEPGGMYSVLAAKYASFEVLDVLVPSVIVKS